MRSLVLDVVATSVGALVVAADQNLNGVVAK
jgi:hypothetical protein